MAAGPCSRSSKVPRTFPAPTDHHGVPRRPPAAVPAWHRVPGSVLELPRLRSQVPSASHLRPPLSGLPSAAPSSGRRSRPPPAAGHSQHPRQPSKHPLRPPSAAPDSWLHPVPRLDLQWPSRPPSSTSESSRRPRPPARRPQHPQFWLGGPDVPGLRLGSPDVPGLQLGGPDVLGLRLGSLVVPGLRLGGPIVLGLWLGGPVVPGLRLGGPDICRPRLGGPVVLGLRLGGPALSVSSKIDPELSSVASRSSGGPRPPAGVSGHPVSNGGHELFVPASSWLASAYSSPASQHVSVSASSSSAASALSAS